VTVQAPIGETTPSHDATPPGVGARWRAVPRRWRVTLVVLVAVAGADAVVGVARSAGSTGGQVASGPSSSFDSSPSGTEAMAELLSHYGHQVTRLQVAYSRAAVPVSNTVVVADPGGWDTGQTEALTSFVRAGGRVVLAGGPFSSAILRTVLGTRDIPVLSPVGVPSAVAVDAAPEVSGVSVVAADPMGGAWDEVGATTPILRHGDASLAVVAHAGAGRIVLLASASPLRNGYLGFADNAAFALNLAGGPRRAVTFDEYVHGFGRGGGLGALPAHWKWALLVAGLAVLVWMWSAARRFGPPEHSERAVAPPRVEYVDGLATVLAATDVRRVGEAVAPVGRAARASLCRYMGVPADTADDVMVAAALASRLSDELVRAALTPPTDKESALATGRALAWFEHERRAHP
jgi:hypothetical protein